MTTNRNIATCVILSIVTCGIYGLYWFIKLTDEVNAASGDTSATSGGMALVLTLVTCGIYGYYWAYKMGVKMNNAQGNPSGSNQILTLILEIFALNIVNLCLLQNEINKRAF